MTTGASIAHYKITSKLGEGGMGAVYRATDTKLNRDVAIKVLPPAFAQDSARMQRFEREAQVLASLNHPNIAAIYGIEAGAIVMELVEGSEPKAPLSAEAILPLLSQLVDALEYAHERGIVHRDLKPANIKVTPDGTLKLLDFGLAKAVETVAPSAPVADSPTLTIAASMPGVIMGTAGYMSPEQARGGKVDHRTDIWAFGVLLFELLTARRAFPGDTVSDILAGVLKSEVDFTPVPGRFRPLVERCLARDLKRRLGWIGDARMLLEAPAAQPARPARRAAIAAGILLAAATGFAVARFIPSNTSSGRLPAVKITRVTTDPTSGSPAISSDGKLIAYTARRERRQTSDIWVQQVGGGSAIRLTDDPTLTHLSPPVFSADSTKIYYYSSREPAGIYEVPVLGGEPRLAIAGLGVHYVNPSPDGAWLAYTLNGNLLLRPTDGGEPHILLPTKAAFAGRWSPDSKRILAVGAVTNGNTMELMSVPIDGSAPQHLPDMIANLARRGFGDFNLLRMVAWLPNGDVIFNARYGDATNLWRLPLAHLGDGMPSAVTLGAWTNAMASVGGNRLVFANSRGTQQVWRLPADLDSGKVNGVPERITADLTESQFPDVRPDDSLLTYISRKTGGQGVYLLDLKTGRDRLLYQSEISSAYSTFSPDGTQVAFGRGGAGWPSFVVPAAGGDAKPVGKVEGRIRGWTRDGRYLLIWRVIPGKPTTIGVFEFATARAVETMHAEKELVQPRLSPDNRWLAFQVESGQRSNIWIAPFRGAAPVPESDWIRIAPGASPIWSPDSGTLYFARYPEGAADASLLMRQPLDPSSGRPSAPPTEFYRFEGNLDNPVINTPVASRTHVYTLLRSGMSEIWMMDLPK